MAVRYKELHFTNKETEAQRVGKELGLYSTSNQWTLYLIEYGCESWTIKKAERQLMLFNCGVGEDSWESPGLQGDPTSPS